MLRKLPPSDMLQPSSLLVFLLWAESLAQSPIYWMIMDSNVTVVPGLSYFIPCQVYFPLYWREPLENNSSGEKLIYSYWYLARHKVITDLPVAAREGDKEVLELTKNRFQMLGNPHHNDCSLMIREPRKEDEGFYVYRIIQGLRAFTYSWHPLYLHVSDTLLPPDISMPKILYSGVPSNVTCSVRWVTPWETDLIIAWKATASAQLGPRFNTSSILTVTPVRADNDSSITCLVFFPDVHIQVERTVKVLVSCDPQISGSCHTDPEPKVVFHTLVEGALTGTGITIILSSCLYLMYYVRTQRKEPMRAQRVKKKKVGQAPTRPASTSISDESPVPSPEANIVDTQSFKGVKPTMGQQEQFQPSITTSMPIPEKKAPSVEDVSTLPSLQLLPPTPPKLSREPSLVSSMRNSEAEIPSLLP